MQIDTNKIVRCLRQSLICGVIVGAATLFVASNLMGYIWHLRNGDTVVVSRWRFPVPKGYWTFDAGKNSFMNLSFGAPFFHKNYGFISFYAHEPRKDPAYTDQRLEFAIVKTATDSGLRLQERRTIQSLSGENLCFQFVTPSRLDQVEIRCMSISGPAVFYRGSRRFSSETYSVVAGIQPI